LKSDILSFIKRTHPLRYLHGLLDGYLDVDRLEFVARDTRTAGVTYGFHELDWLVRSLRIVRKPQTIGEGGTIHPASWVLAVDSRKGLFALWQFLEARANMYRQVYLHKTVRSATVMFCLILKRATELQLTCPSVSLTQYLQSPEVLNLHQCLALDDSDVIAAIKHWSQPNTQDAIVRSLCDGFLRRELYKVILLNEDTYDRLSALKDYIDSIVAQRMSVSKDLADYYYTLDKATFKVLGDEQLNEGQIWILGSSKYGPALTSLPEAWREYTHQENFHECRYYLICHKSMVQDLTRLCDRLRAGRSTSLSLVPPNGYRLLALLGEGAHKTTYLAAPTSKPGTESPLCAVKYLKYEVDLSPDQAEDSDNASRSINDLLGNILGLEHSNLTNPHVIGSDATGTWMYEPLWDGTLLAVILEQGPLRDLGQILDVITQLFDGLTRLHSANLRHSDLKPDNCGFILRASGATPTFTYQIGDFGCASTQPSHIPNNPDSLGSIKTRAPELFGESKRIDLGSDVWALAATVFAAVALRYPFMKLNTDTRDPDVRSRIEGDIQANLTDRLESFRADVETQLPQPLVACLSPCFKDLGERASASDVLKEAQAQRDKFHSLVQAEPEAQFAWERAEMLSTMLTQGDSIDKAPLIELKALSERFNKILPRCIITLAEKGSEQLT